MLSKRTWVILWLDKGVEVHEEHTDEAQAQKRANELRARVVKVYRRDVWSPATPPESD